MMFAKKLIKSQPVRCRQKSRNLYRSLDTGILLPVCNKNTFHLYVNLFRSGLFCGRRQYLRHPPVQRDCHHPAHIHVPRWFHRLTRYREYTVFTPFLGPYPYTAGSRSGSMKDKKYIVKHVRVGIL